MFTSAVLSKISLPVQKLQVAALNALKQHPEYETLREWLTGVQKRHIESLEEKNRRTIGTEAHLEKLRQARKENAED